MPLSSIAVEWRREGRGMSLEDGCLVDLERDGGGGAPLPNIPEKLMPREVDGRALPSSEPEDLEPFSRWSRSAGLRADFERDKVAGLSLTGDEGLLLELDFGGGA